MKMRNLAVMSLLVSGLFLAACTRQASTQPVPTNPPAQSTTGAAEDPTMAAVRLTAAVRATQAVADTQTAQPAEALGTPQAADLTPQATAGSKDLSTPEAVATTEVTTAVAPLPSATPASAACSNPYIVKPGDWIYKIARDCQVAPSALLAANPGINPNFVTPGQKLNIPAVGGTTSQAQQTQTCSGTYTVAGGDTLYSIAYRCGLTTEQLATANSIRYPFVIHVGDVLKFP
jgi:LysM repeat protein